MKQTRNNTAQKIDVEGMGPSDDTATHKPVADGGVANDDAPTSDECGALHRHVDAMNDVCSDYTALTNAQRRTSLGRHVTRFRKPLSDMLTVTRSAQYAPAFALLSSSGAKPFSPSAILAALDRVEQLEAIAVKLEQLHPPRARRDPPHRRQRHQADASQPSSSPRSSRRTTRTSARRSPTPSTTSAP